jgi:hypothetical protein
VWSTPQVTQEIVDCLGAPQVATLENVGHLPNREDQARFDAELSSFLETVSPACESRVPVRPRRGSRARRRG